MFYSQFLKVTKIDSGILEKFDYWLATLPTHDQQYITASAVASKLRTSYETGNELLSIAFREKIVEKNYIIICPRCESTLGCYSADELADMLSTSVCCDECGQSFVLSAENVYIAYKLIQQPDVSSEELDTAISRHLEIEGTQPINFTNADSLVSHQNLYEFFYCPDESAYEEFNNLRDLLDVDYGNNTTAQGKALENLVAAIFRKIKYVRVSQDVESETNQFDCSAICGIKANETLSVLSLLSPYFIIESKNEKEKPNNTYFNKLLAIMDTTSAQLGIVVGRRKATKTCNVISREHFLTHKSDLKQQIILAFSDEDMSMIIDRRINLLQYLEYKIFQVTANDFAVTFDSFVDH